MHAVKLFAAVAFENLPLGQSMQRLLPAADENLPAGHLVQFCGELAATASELQPCGQATHCVEPAREYVPVAQTSHEVLALSE